MNYKYVIFASANEIMNADFSLLENQGIKIFFLYSELKKYSDMVASLDKEKRKEFNEKNRFINNALANKSAQAIGNGIDLLEYQGIDILLRAYKKGNIAIVVTNPDAYPRFKAFQAIYNDAGFTLDIDTFAHLFALTQKPTEEPVKEQEMPQEPVEEKVEEPKEENEEVEKAAMEENVPNEPVEEEPQVEEKVEEIQEPAPEKLEEIQEPAPEKLEEKPEEKVEEKKEDDSEGDDKNNDIFNLTF